MYVSRIPLPSPQNPKKGFKERYVNYALPCSFLFVCLLYPLLLPSEISPRAQKFDTSCSHSRIKKGGPFALLPSTPEGTNKPEKITDQKSVPLMRLSASVTSPRRREREKKKKKTPRTDTNASSGWAGQGRSEPSIRPIDPGYLPSTSREECLGITLELTSSSRDSKLAFVLPTSGDLICMSFDKASAEQLQLRLQQQSGSTETGA